MITWMYGALLAWAAVGVSPAENELEEVIARLAAMEARLELLVLPFEARHHPAPTGDRLTFGKSGWWIRDGARIGLHIHDLAQDPPTVSRAVRDGAGVTHVAGEDGLDTRFVDTAQIGHPFTTYLPNWFFLDHWHRPWSELLGGKHGGRASILGKEVVGDAECTVVQHDSGVPARPGACVRVWIDAQGRVRMAQSFHPDPTPAEEAPFTTGPTPLSALRFVGEGQRSFSARLRWRPLEWTTLSDGLSIPILMDQEYLTSPGHPAVRVTVDVEGIRVGDRAAAEALLDVRPSRWVPATSDTDSARSESGPHGSDEEGSARGPESAGSLLGLEPRDGTATRVPDRPRDPGPQASSGEGLGGIRPLLAHGIFWLSILGLGVGVAGLLLARRTHPNRA